MSNKSGRRDFLKATAAGAAVASLGAGVNFANATSAKPQIKVAGYDYDRVRGIMDGKVGIEGTDVSFHYEDIYAVNDLAFGPNPKYDVTEMGLIPYVNKFVNEDFRAYTLIPVFISRVFRHRNVFVHADSGIEKPECLFASKTAPGFASKIAPP